MTQEDFDALQKRARAKHRIPEPDPPQAITYHADEPPAHLTLEKARNKYGARKTWYKGRRFDSAMEARAARRLDLLVTCGELVEWEPQVMIRVFVNAGRLDWQEGGEAPERVIMRSKVDFRLTHPDGRVTYLEVKGYKVRDWPLRARLFKAAGVPIEVERKG
jgi:hypothetical protein